MKKLLTCLGVAALFSTSAYADYLCSYTAYISDSNKYNSNGVSVIKGINKNSAAQVLRQNRADVHRFGTGTFGDTEDCYFDSVESRDKLPQMLNRGSISKATIRQIVNGNPLLQVDIYSTHIDVKPY